jgi:outer membrane lipoprotein SlyB
MNKIKPIIFPLMLLMLFVACKSNKKTETRDIQLLSDSTAYNNNTLTDSSRTGNVDAVPAASVHHKTVSPSRSNTSATTRSGSKSSTVSSGNTSSSSTSSSQGTQKKGWSKAAQGAVIGGAAGAVGGAIISKHKGTGAAIGAAVGAAGGYIIGRNKDKKDGRVKK